MENLPLNPATTAGQRRKKGAGKQIIPDPIQTGVADVQGGIIKQELSVQAVAIEPIMDRAREVIGDREGAMRWLGTPVRALDFATPISMLATAEGVDKVLDALGQMERGVW